MHMPKAAMDEDQLPAPWQHEVWPAVDVLPLELETVPQRMNHGAEHELWLRVPVPNPGHAVPTLGGGE
jgi:hypothetical protein